MTIKVLVADDQELVPRGIETILDGQEDLTVVGGAADGDEAVATVRSHAPDVVLMDVRMPRTDGLEATHRIVAGPPRHPRVIALTTFDADDYVLASLQAGASGVPPCWTCRTGARRGGAPGRRGRQPACHEHHVAARSRSAAACRTPRSARLHLSESTVKTYVGQLLAKTGRQDRVHLVILGFRAGLVPPQGVVDHP